MNAIACIANLSRCFYTLEDAKIAHHPSKKQTQRQLPLYSTYIADTIRDREDTVPGKHSGAASAHSKQ